MLLHIDCVRECFPAQPQLDLDITVFFCRFNENGKRAIGICNRLRAPILVAIDDSLFALDINVLKGYRCIISIGGSTGDLVGLCLGIYAE